MVSNGSIEAIEGHHIWNATICLVWGPTFSMCNPCSFTGLEFCPIFCSLTIVMLWFPVCLQVLLMLPTIHTYILDPFANAVALKKSTVHVSILLHYYYILVCGLLAMYV